MARVLIVDDSKMMRTLEKSMLEKMGHEVVDEATNGLDGYDKYFALKPDIVLIDMTMPIMDGVTTIQKMIQKDKDAKIILITSNTQNEKLKNAVEAGVSEIVFKPIDEEQLKNTIEQILSKK